MSSENPHGPVIRNDGTVRFRLWAPSCERVQIELAGARHAMNPSSAGWHELITAGTGPGSRYCFVLPDGMRVPDPASRYQPEGVHGPSELVHTESWQWDEGGWKGAPWEQYVIYELHIGTFTSEGTFSAAIGRLDHLAALGVTAVELMPVACFPGKRDWGYDGVLPYAPATAYGRPEGLKAFIEAAHRRGLAVVLDVVYNHFGPEGNYLSLYAREFFTRTHKTPWGDAINYDGPGCQPVREFVIHNALYWVEQFHIDALRMDAVDAIKDDGPVHILDELARRVRAASKRTVHLVLENYNNEASWLERHDDGMTPCFYTAQWNDDVHHALHTAVTGERTGYYADYCGDTGKLGRALAEGFSFQGQVMSYRGRTRGEPSGHLPADAFVSFLQNHDQIGNRAFGDRISTLAPRKAVRAAAAVYLLLPQVPLLFMGEEWNCLQPFPFFCDFGPDLASAVKTGRRNEFAKFPAFQDPEQRERIPDPHAEETFRSAVLHWDQLDEPEHREWLRWYWRILAKRREFVIPLIPGIRTGGEYVTKGDGAVIVRWCSGSSVLTLAANLSQSAVGGFTAPPPWLIWKEGNLADGGRTLGPWTVLWWTAPRSGEITFRDGIDA